MNLAEAAAIVGVGFAAGSINVVVGSGTLITFPTLLALGYQPVVANVSNSVGLSLGSMAGAWGYRRELAGQRQRMIRFSVVGVVGAVAGAVLLLTTPPGAFEAIVPGLVALGCVLVAGQPWLAGWLRHRPRHEHGGPGAVLLVLATAVYGGYFGAAQGVLLLAIFGLTINESLQRLNAIKNVQSGLVNLVSGLVFVISGDVDWAVAGLIASGAILGGLLGARIGRRLPALALRCVVVTVGVVAITVMLWP